MSMPAQEITIQVPKTRLTVTVRNTQDGYGPANLETIVEALRQLFKHITVDLSKSGFGHSPFTEVDRIVIAAPCVFNDEEFQKLAEARGYVKKYSFEQAMFIEDLRRLTGSGLMTCRDAAEASGWDLKLAIAYITTKGLAYHIKRKTV